MNKDDFNKQGVYIIRNTVNNKVYVGSTINSFSKRWCCHRKRLNKGIHHSAHLQSAWNKYGSSSFNFEIVEVVHPTKCREREKYYIELYKATNPKLGYNVADIDILGNPKVSEKTKAKLSLIAKEQWKNKKHTNEFKKGVPSWNKGLKCASISETRRKMFSSIQVYKNNTLIATFRSATDLEEWSRNNELPGMIYYTSKYNRPNKGHRTTHILGSNIHRAIRNNAIYRGFRFKKSLPLPPEMGVVKWENCWNGEIPNQQPSLPLTKQEGSETNS